MKADSSVDRDILVRRLQEDLVGPRSSDEVLMDRPSDVYLTGILWPQRTGMAGEDDDSLAIGGSSSADDGQDSEAAAVPVMSIQKPSVAGISFCFTSEGTAHVRLFCRFARYRFVEDAEKQEKSWRRIGIDVDIETLELGDGSRFFDLGTVMARAAMDSSSPRCSRPRYESCPALAPAWCRSLRDAGCPILVSIQMNSRRLCCSATHTNLQPATPAPQYGTRRRE